MYLVFVVVEFQSTLSVRRATFKIADKSFTVTISIHALRKESDVVSEEDAAKAVISIHALRKESDLLHGLLRVESPRISIHALRKESDHRPAKCIRRYW